MTHNSLVERPRGSLSRQVLGRELRRARFLYQLRHISPDWLNVARSQIQTDHPLPPLRLRDGMTLHHGRWDNPLGLLRDVHIDRWYEIEESPTPGSVLLDIGANIGAVSLYWAAKHPSLVIHAYEPNPSTFETLRTNIEANTLQDRMEAFPEALGPHPGEASLWVDIRSDLSTTHSDESPAQGGRRIVVPMIGMDEVWERLEQSRIWLFKLDVEGAEADILETTPDAMLHATRHAIVEYHDNICPGVGERCRSVLRAAGFHWTERTHPWNEGILYARRTDPLDAC